MNDTLAVRLLLSRRGLMNQEELAEKAGIRRGYISELETGKATNPTVGVVERLSEALGVRPEYLACWSDDPLGETSPGLSLGEGRVIYDVATPRERRLIQEVLDLFSDLSSERQELALRLLEELTSAQRSRIVGAE